jgi:hypothetical protein
VQKSSRINFELLASRLRPLLNRLVFYGIETCRKELGNSAKVRAPTVESRSFHALATSTLDRLGAELSAAGLTRVARRGATEQWQTPEGLVLNLEGVSSDGAAGQDESVLEYATLLTRTVPLDSTSAVRVSALPAQLPLWWRAHARSGLAFSDSPWVEDIIELVVRRDTIRDDVAALPAELKDLAAAATESFVTSDDAAWAIERVLPDAMNARGVTETALARFREISWLISRGTTFG